MHVELSSQLKEALTIYSEIERELVAVGKRNDPAGRLALVRGRRRLAEQTGVVGELIEKDQLLAKTPVKQAELSRVFTTFRYALGTHMANWPAVKIDEDRLAYAESARKTYHKADIFWDWCAINLNLQR